MKQGLSILRGGAAVALPLLLVWAWAAPAAAFENGTVPASMTGGQDAGEEAPHLDAIGMLLSARPEALDDMAKALGYPTTGAQFDLYGGGATLGKGPLRFGVQALVGGLSARQGGLSTEWRLRLGNLILEQRYPYGPVDITGGTILSYALTEGLLENDSQITRFDAQSYGGGLVAGARWPRGTKLGFFLRGGYLWMPVSGTWKGALLNQNPKSSFDLGGPLAQFQVELSF